MLCKRIANSKWSCAPRPNRLSARVVRICVLFLAPPQLMLRLRSGGRTAATGSFAAAYPSWSLLGRSFSGSIASIGPITQ